MAQEIERKFLIKDTSFLKEFIDTGHKLTQGYLCTDPHRTVRIRKNNLVSHLTIKGISTDDGLSRYEFEKRISYEEAEELLKLCEPTNIFVKTRYIVVYHGKVWEVDVFGENDNILFLAEIELQSENEKFDLPPWVGEEVTGDVQYYNTNIMKQL